MHGKDPLVFPSPDYPSLTVTIKKKNDWSTHLNSFGDWLKPVLRAANESEPQLGGRLLSKNILK